MKNNFFVNENILKQFSELFFYDIVNNKNLPIKHFADISCRFWSDYFKIPNYEIILFDSKDYVYAMSSNINNINKIYLPKMVTKPTDDVKNKLDIFSAIGHEFAHLADRQKYSLNNKTLEQGISFARLFDYCANNKNICPELSVFCDYNYYFNKREQLAFSYEWYGKAIVINALIKVYNNKVSLNDLSKTKLNHIKSVILSVIEENKIENQRFKDKKAFLKINYQKAEECVLNHYKNALYSHIKNINQTSYYLNLPNLLNFQNIDKFFDLNSLNIIKDFALKQKDYVLVGMIHNIKNYPCSYQTIQNNINKLLLNNFSAENIFSIYNNLNPVIIKNMIGNYELEMC